MGITENVNRSNAEAGDYTFARWIVKPRLDWKTAKLQEQLIPKFRNSKNLQLGFEEVVPETIEQKMLLAESGIRAGYLTINEARKLRGLDPLPNGDVLLVPLNLIPTPVSGKINIQTPVQPAEQPKSKSLSDEYKEARWNTYTQKTAKQEVVLGKLLTDIFADQKEQITTSYKETGGLPVLDENSTAKKLQPIVELIYQSAFDEAI